MSRVPATHANLRLYMVRHRIPLNPTTHRGRRYHPEEGPASAVYAPLSPIVYTAYHPAGSNQPFRASNTPANTSNKAVTTPQRIAFYGSGFLAGSGTLRRDCLEDCTVDWSKDADRT
jgi:hypothetical protein